MVPFHSQRQSIFSKKPQWEGVYHNVKERGWGDDKAFTVSAQTEEKKS